MTLGRSTSALDIINSGTTPQIDFDFQIESVGAKDKHTIGVFGPPSLTMNENNNNESYISSVGDSADSASNVHVACVAAASSSPKSDKICKSGRSEDRIGTGGTALMFTPLIESTIAPTLDHEIKGA